MRRIICLVILLCFFLCGCSQDHDELRTFSYTEHCIEYADQKVSIRKTQDQTKQPVKNAEDAIAIAKNYCLINNAETMVEYDPFTGVYCVVFIPVYEIDGNILYYTDSPNVHVYVNADGIVLMTVRVG